MKLDPRAIRECALVAALATAYTATAVGKEVPSPIEPVPIPNASVFDGSVLLGGQPTQENLAAAAEAGYRTIVDLRTPGELEGWDEREAVESLGLRYVSIPIRGAAGFSRENAERLAEALAATEDRPMMVHCGSGNRVGGLLALKGYYVDGLDAAAALRLGLDHGLTSLERAVAEHLERAEATP